MFPISLLKGICDYIEKEKFSKENLAIFHDI